MEMEKKTKNGVKKEEWDFLPPQPFQKGVSVLAVQ